MLAVPVGKTQLKSCIISRSSSSIPILRHYQMLKNKKLQQLTNNEEKAILIHYLTTSSQFVPKKLV